MVFCEMPSVPFRGVMSNVVYDNFRRPICCGTGGRFPMESVAGMAWNTQPSEEIP